MGYYKVLGLHREPFSTSPDPSLFFLSREHRAALFRLRISVKLRRGLSLILGDVGTGKTTLSRLFIQLASQEPKVSIHMILNPFFHDELDFLKELCRRFNVPVNFESQNPSFYFNEIEHFLLRKGADEGLTTVLLIDEAQKLNVASLEVLRGLLNYETNEYKLLQLVLVSQMELVPNIVRIRNIWDRISLKHVLKPLDLDEMRQMINFRLHAAGYQSPLQLFTEEALQAIHRWTRGFPRQVTQVCHDCLESLVMYNRSCVDKSLVEELILKDNDWMPWKGHAEAEADGSTHERAERPDARRALI